MSLRVWLPLNGNLENKGISGNLIQVTAPTWVNGKIGQAMSAGALKMDAATTASILNNQEFSFCCWVYVNADAGDTSKRAMFFGNNPMGANNNRKFSIFQYPTCNDIHLSWQNDAENTVFAGAVWSGELPSYQWTHLAITYKNPNGFMYINGILKHQFTGTSNSSSFAYETNLMANGGTFKYLNDYRIYDHCLSAAEVKEISQGLVLHYKLSGNNLFNVNTLTHGNYLFSNGNSGTDSGWALTDYIQVTPLTSYIGYNLVNGGNGNPSICFYNKTKTYTRGLTITANTPLAVTTESTEYYVRISIRKTNNDINKMSFFEIPKIIQDSSGYNHNLTVTGDLLCDNTTPRYSCSTYFNGSSYGWTNKFMSWFQFDACTISAWIKPTISVSSWTGSIGVAADANAGSKSFGITDYADKFRIAYNNGTSYKTIDSGQSLPVDEWHHIAATLEATTVKMYFDGTLVKTATIDWGTATINANTGFQIGVDVPGTDEKFTGNYSDVRFYCTSLLDTDIKQLYNVGMKVDNKGNIHAYEFKEQSGETKFEKTGVIRAFEINENKYYDNKGRVGKWAWADILHSSYYAITTKDSHTATGSIPSIPAATIQSLAGKTLRFSYDVCTLGNRLSTENGDTAWNKIRYGIHGAMSYVNASGTSGTSYPFAGFLEYSGDKKHCIQTWTIPTGYQSYGDLAFSPQPFDRPGSTNNNTWFLNNVKLEISSNTAPGGWVSGTQIIER